jgi:hypothetical protein
VEKKKISRSCLESNPGRPARRTARQDNIKLGIEEMSGGGCGLADWYELGNENLGNSLSSWATITFLKSLLHGVRWIMKILAENVLP